jgi:hypothetical protein
MKKYLLITSILAIAILSFLVGRATYNISIPIGPAALSIPFLNDTTQKIRTCIDKKCVEVTSQCSSDTECATHMQCNSLRQCVTVKGAGKNQCSINGDCIEIKDPQKWCDAKNPKLYTIATKYPNGNFSCTCYSTKNPGDRAQINCIDAHLNQ